MHLICPHCFSPLIISNQSFVCEANHSFDIAKEGYVNLLPVNQKKTLEPGDNKDMIDARRSFLEKGYYMPLVTFIKEKFVDILNSANSFLDAGCGEGYYTNLIMDHNPAVKYGFDISKFAVKRASKKYKQTQFFIASVFSMPILSSSIDLALQIFAPTHESELNRILNATGNLIIVSAGPNHLKELAEVVYGNFKEHTYNPEKSLKTAFILKQKEDIQFSISLNENKDILDLWKMTPYYWNASLESAASLKKLSSLEITCDFQMHLFQKRLPN